MLRGMGFDNTTSLYVASGKIYNAEKYMTPLRELFPLLQTKETLTSPEELAQFKVISPSLSYSIFIIIVTVERPHSYIISQQASITLVQFEGRVTVG